jgi:hypothetical protein
VESGERVRSEERAGAILSEARDGSVRGSWRFRRRGRSPIEHDLRVPCASRLLTGAALARVAPPPLVLFLPHAPLVSFFFRSRTYSISLAMSILGPLFVCTQTMSSCAAMQKLTMPIMA